MRCEQFAGHKQDDRDLYERHSRTQYHPPPQDIGYVLLTFVAVLVAVAALGLPIVVIAAGVSRGSFAKAFDRVASAYLLGTILACRLPAIVRNAVTALSLRARPSAPPCDE